MFNPLWSDRLEKMASRFTVAFSAVGLNNLNDLQKAARQRYRKVSQIGEYEGGAKPAAAEWQEDVINLGDVTLNLPPPPAAPKSSGIAKGLGIAALGAALTGVGGAGGAGLAYMLSKENTPAVEAPKFTDTDTAVDVLLPKGTLVDGP